MLWLMPLAFAATPHPAAATSPNHPAQPHAQDAKPSRTATPLPTHPLRASLEAPSRPEQVGPRCTLNPIKMFAGSFGGPVIYENASYVSPNTVREGRVGAEGWRLTSAWRGRAKQAQK